jgi:hypothetical protein
LEKEFILKINEFNNVVAKRWWYAKWYCKSIWWWRRIRPL